MKNLLRLLLALMPAIAFSSARAQSVNPLVNHIPVDAEKVYYINYTVLSGKLDWHALAAVVPKKEESQRIFAMLSSPGEMGIDVRPGLFITQSNILSLDSPRYTSLIFALSDSAKFIKFLKGGNQSEGNKLTIHPGRLRTAVQGKTVFVWNDKIVVITSVRAPMLPVMIEKGSGSQPSADVNLRKYMLTATRRSLAALKGSEANPLPSDADFLAAIGDDADVHIYSRMGGGFGMMADIMKITHAPINNEFVAAMEKMKHAHVHSIGTVRFDNGKMSLRSRLFYDSLAGLDIGMRPINTGLIERLPQGNLLGFFALHFDPQSYMKVIERFGGAKATHLLDSMLAKKGVTTKDILSAFKGDVIVAAIDNGKTIPATDSTPAKPGKPDIYGVVTIADKAAFEKFDNLVHLTRDSAAAPTGDTPAKPKFHMAHTLRDDILVLGADKQTTENFFNQGGRGPGRLESDALRDASFAFAIDVKAIGAWLGPSLAGASSKNQQVKIVLDLFDQVMFATYPIRGNEVDMLFEIKMADQQQNSLTTISKLISQMGGPH